MRMDSRDRNLLRGMVVAAEVLSLLAFWTQNFAITYPGPAMPVSAVIFAAIHTAANFALCVFLIRAGLLSKTASWVLLVLSVCSLQIYPISGGRMLFRLLESPLLRTVEGVKSFALCTVEIACRSVCVCLASAQQKGRKTAAA